VPLTPRQAIEIFHLVFLRALVAKGDDKSLFALKGGCNLRFFFGSVRYSEDIDFDVIVVRKDTLKNKVDRLLRSPLVTSPLKSQGLEITETSTPKQTDTTQRWKVGLAVQGLSVLLRTKIEFSRRDAILGASFEGIGRDVLHPYRLTPFLATHYRTQAAIAQKIHALADRATPQARDVFDLNQLFARPDAESTSLTSKERVWLPVAIDHARDLSFDEYVSKVVAFLAPEQADLFRTRAAWGAMQDAVVAQLEELS